jgi:3-(3-hydroxy-phenyl)propionate hydroxylase
MHQPELKPQQSSYFNYTIHPFVRPPEMQGQTPRHTVVVVGTGPNGLLLALDLARNGARPLMITAEAQVCGGSRAVAFTRRTLEIFEQVGASDAVLEGALLWDKGRSFYRGHMVHELQIPGSVDDRFLEKAEQAGIEVRWQTKVAGIESDESGVRLRLDTPEGEYDLECDWLVACDGARSTIRRLQNLRFEGRSYTGRFVIIDFRVPLGAPTARRCYFDPPWLPGHAVLLHKSPYGIWRLDYQVPDDISDEQALEPERLREHVQAHLDYIGADLPWEIEWVTLYKPNTLTLARYNHGRVLYSGDAAHLLPVFGVRGVNTGVQDGNNLAWKLSSVVRGIAPPSLLDSFTHERLADAKRICFEAARSTRMMAPPSRGYRILRDAVLQLSVDHEFTRPLLHWRTSRPMDYADSPLTTTDPTESHFAAGPRPGATARNVCVNPDSAERSWLFDAFAPGFQVLVFGEHAETIQQVVDDIAALRGERVPVRLLSIQRASTPASVATDAVVLDPLGRIHETWGAAAGAVYVLRPDQHVAARWTLDSSARVAQVVRKALGREATAAAATTEIAEALA